MEDNKDFQEESRVIEEQKEEKLKDVTEGYYDTKGKKVVDFCGGFFGAFFGILALNLLYNIVISLLNYFMQSFNIGFGLLEGILFLVINLCSIIGFPIYFIKFTKRKYIGIGILSLFGTVLIVVGGCFAIIMSAYR